VIGGAPYYFSFDQLGSVREIVDASGAIQHRYDYDSWGRLTVLQGSAPRFGYSGYFYHAPSGLYLSRTRAYDPDLGRWISPDPIEEEGGTDLYTYVDNDPVNEIDPMGLQAGCGECPCPPGYHPHPPRKPKHPPKKGKPRKPPKKKSGPPRDPNAFPQACPGSILCLSSPQPTPERPPSIQWGPSVDGEPVPQKEDEPCWTCPIVRARDQFDEQWEEYWEKENERVNRWFEREEDPHPPENWWEVMEQLNHQMKKAGGQTGTQEYP